MLNIKDIGVYNLEDASFEKLYTTEKNGFINSTLCRTEKNSLFDATLLSLQTGSLAPIVKEELRYTIQSRRLAKGQKELTVDFPESVKYELTDDEKEKIIRRREQNRHAAQRFRSKKKDNSKKLIQKISVLESENTAKRIELNNLKEEKSKLQKLLYEHIKVCPNLPTRTLQP